MFIPAQEGNSKYAHHWALSSGSPCKSVFSFRSGSGSSPNGGAWIRSSQWKHTFGKGTVAMGLWKFRDPTGALKVPNPGAGKVLCLGPHSTLEEISCPLCSGLCPLEGSSCLPPSWGTSEVDAAGGRWWAFPESCLVLTVPYLLEQGCFSSPTVKMTGKGLGMWGFVCFPRKSLKILAKSHLFASSPCRGPVTTPRVFP